MDTYNMYKALRGVFNSDHRLENSYMFQWESDIWLLTTSGLSVEIEVKTSRSDFLVDFKKVKKHRLLSNHKESCLSIPNRFYYACPKGLITIEEVPSYSGLIHVDGLEHTVVKKAPLLHRDKKNWDAKLKSKYSWRRTNVLHEVIDAKYAIEMLSDKDQLSLLKRKLDVIENILR